MCPMKGILGYKIGGVPASGRARSHRSSKAALKKATATPTTSICKVDMTANNAPGIAQLQELEASSLRGWSI